MFLEPTSALAAAQRLARDTGDTLSVGAKTLHRRLQEKGILRSTEPSRGTLLVRRVLARARRNVLHLSAGSLIPRECDQSDQLEQEGSSYGRIGQKPWSAVLPFPDHEPTSITSQIPGNTGPELDTHLATMPVVGLVRSWVP